MPYKNKELKRLYQIEADKRYRKTNPKKYRERYLKRSKLRSWFLGKQIYIGFRQLTGYCSQCPNSIFDGIHRRTDMHHVFYLPCMPWACRTELCVPCHRKITQFRLSLIELV